MDNPIQGEEKESKDSLYITQGRTERSPGRRLRKDSQRNRRDTQNQEGSFQKRRNG